jgi:hypothetical protein
MPLGFYPIAVEMSRRIEQYGHRVRMSWSIAWFDENQIAR